MVDPFITCLFIRIHNYFTSNLFSTPGNFGIVFKAWYTKDNGRTKVAIKALKG